MSSMTLANCTAGSAALCMQILSQLSHALVDNSMRDVTPPPMQPHGFRPTFHAYPALPQPQQQQYRHTYSSYVSAGSTVRGVNSPMLHPGSFEPPLGANKYRLYSMRFCPYAERVLLYLTKKNIPVEVVNVNPDQSPNWYLAKSPLGRIPALEYNGKVIWESSVIAEYLDEVFPSSTILPRDSYDKAHQKILVERLSSLMNVVFDYYRGQTPQIQRQTDQSVHQALRNAESLLRDQFYGGRQPGFADYMIWPFLERLELLTVTPTSQFRYFPGAHYPKMGAYIARMQAQPEVKYIARPLQQHKGYVDSFSSGRPNYDYGINSIQYNG